MMIRSSILYGREATRRCVGRKRNRRRPLLPTAAGVPYSGTTPLIRRKNSSRRNLHHHGNSPAIPYLSQQPQLKLGQTVGSNSTSRRYLGALTTRNPPPVDDVSSNHSNNNDKRMMDLFLYTQLPPYSPAVEVAETLGLDTVTLNHWLETCWLETLRQEQSKQKRRRRKSKGFRENERPALPMDFLDMLDDGAVASGRDQRAGVSSWFEGDSETEQPSEAEDIWRLRPDAYTYYLLLEGARLYPVHQQPKKRAILLEDVLKLLLASAAAKSDDDSARLDPRQHILHSIHKVMTAWVQAKEVGKAEWWLRQLESNLQRSMQQKPSNSDSSKLPDSTISSDATTEAAVVAIGVLPTNATFSIVLAGWAKRGAPRRAEAVLDRLIALSSSSNEAEQQQKGITPTPPAVQVTSENFQTCLNAWIQLNNDRTTNRNNKTQAQQQAAGPRAELLVVKMHELHLQGVLEQPPGLETLIKILRAWDKAMSHQPVSTSNAQRALGIVEIMLQQQISANGMANNKSSSVSNERDWVLLAEGHALAMKACLSCCEDQEALEKARDLWKQLLDCLQQQEQNATSDPRMMTTSKSFLSKPEVQRMFHVHVLTALAYTDRPDAIKCVDVLLNELSCHQQGDGDKNPITAGGGVWDTQTCNWLLHIYARAGNGERAQQLLVRMIRSAQKDNASSSRTMRPDTKSFNSAILAWSRYPLVSHNATAADDDDDDDDPNPALQAEKLFLLMHELNSLRQGRDGEEDRLEPDVVTYNAVLAAMAGTTDARQAHRGEQYLQQLQDYYQETGDPQCRPTAVTYTKAITLWSQVVVDDSRPTLAVDRAESILQELLQRYNASERQDDSLRPNLSTYSAFLSVVQNSNVRDKKERMHEIRERMRSCEELGQTSSDNIFEIRE